MIQEKKCDVLVAGGGLAGTAAAVASARMGLNTILVEKTIFAGGLATSGMILHYLPLSDARGSQVTFGIAEELLHESIKYGAGDIPLDWRNPKGKDRLGSRFSPAAFVLALDEFLQRNNVNVWFDSLICGACVTNGRISSVDIENKSGRIRISAKCFIDATGDCDIAKFAGAKFAEQDNFLSIWSLAVSLEAAKSAVAENNASKLLHLVTAGAGNAGGNLPPGAKKYFGTDGREVSEFILETRRLLREKILNEQEMVGGRKNFFPVALPSMANFRTTRRIIGKYTLKTGEKWRHFNDCIGITADWRGGWDIWEIPYRTLLPEKITGMLAAGRCISSEGEAWEVTRVIQSAAMTGEVCGIAAAMAVRQNTTPDKIKIEELQAELRSRDFVLDLREFGIDNVNMNSEESSENLSHENFYA